MNEFNLHREMIVQVANALGPELLKQVVLVGGCATGLLVTDEFTQEQIRHTDDIDLIVDVATQSDLAKLESKFRERGFKNNIDSTAHIGSWKLGELQVDIIPVNPNLLSSAGGWCKQAYDHAISHPIGGYNINLVTAIYFLALKLEAYFDRGNNDPLESRDIEDILNLVDGRELLVSEFVPAPTHLKQYISDSLIKISKNENFQYAVQSTAQSDNARESLIFQRLNRLTEITS